jgi:uncharacterized protein YukJ
MNNYCMFKGSLLRAAPFEDRYIGSPHYVITVQADDGKPFNIVVNSASTQQGEDGDNHVYLLIDLAFADPIVGKLKLLSLGLHEGDFPRLDYWQDRSLVDLHGMRPIPYESADGQRFDVNDQLNDILTIDESSPSEELPYNNGHQVQNRTFWKPSAVGVVVYGFGFLFPAKDGLHETHMNQGNPRNGGHASENGPFQDGALIVQRGDALVAVFTAFQTQLVPTDMRGFPAPSAVPLPDYIRGH